MLHFSDLLSAMDLSMLVFLFFILPYFECGPMKARKIDGKKESLPKLESIDDGHSNVLVQCLGIVIVMLLSSNIIMIAYLATRKPRTTTTDPNNQSAKPTTNEDSELESMVKALIASETDEQKINLTESIYNSISDSAPNCYILLNVKDFMPNFLKLFEIDDNEIISNCVRIASECSRKHYPNLFMADRRALIVQSGLLNSVFNLFGKYTDIDTLSLAAVVVAECLDAKTANINPGTIKEILKIMAATINETASSEKLSMIKDMNRIIFCLLTETESKPNHADYTENFIKEGGIWTYLEIIRSRTELSIPVVALVFNTIQRALGSTKNADDAEMEIVKRGGWHLAIQFLSRLVHEWEVYMYKDACWEFLEEPAFLIARLIQKRDEYSAYSEIAKFQSFKNDVHNLLDSSIAILDRAATELEENSGHEMRTKFAASNLCKAIRHVSDGLSVKAQNSLMSASNAVKAVGYLVRLMKQGLHEFDSQPIDYTNTTYEAVLAMLQLATADRKGAESVMQHYDQLIIVSATRPIDSPKDIRKRDIDTKIGFWKRQLKSGAREKEECTIM